MPDLLPLTVEEVLTTTRSVRKRLDLERPVEHEVIEQCLRIAMQTPSGSNRQAWQWLFIEDPAIKQKLADIYRKQFDVTYRVTPVGAYDDPKTQAQAVRRRESAVWLADHFEDVPLIMIPCQAGRVDGAGVGEQAGFWGSLLPAVWNFMLALRTRGLGSAWVTMNLARPEGERETAEVLGIPYETYTQAGMFPIGYTKGTDFKPIPTPEVSAVLHWDRW
ncbi:MAG: nitroreductase family protein [Acidobacteria bacterium]|nr:nitroreductase family protein [Acidobacteriota bacterium]